MYLAACVAVFALAYGAAVLMEKLGLLSIERRLLIPRPPEADAGAQVQPGGLPEARA